LHSSAGREGVLVRQEQTDVADQQVLAARILAGEKRNLSFGAYVWRVLEARNDRALLITEDIIEKRPYHTVFSTDVDNTWADCSLRHYLNDEFYGAFSDECKERVLPVELMNADNASYGTAGGTNTEDRIFLLSADEAERLFSSDAERVALFAGAARWWLLRSPGIRRHAAGVGRDGAVNTYGRRIDFAAGGVRPALWFRL
jgi:hypothetical protein